MKWTDLPLRPDTRMLRQFACLWTVFFAGIAVYQVAFADRFLLGTVLGVLAITVGPIGMVRPLAIKPIFVGWIVAAFPVGWLLSLMMLGALFYGIFTPLGWVFRLVGRDALALKPRPDLDTYWLPKPAIEPARYFRTY